jgi:hypothetical protein
MYAPLLNKVEMKVSSPRPALLLLLPHAQGIQALCRQLQRRQAVAEEAGRQADRQTCIRLHHPPATGSYPTP